jgi:hypothetical protein
MQEDDSRLHALPQSAVEHVLALLPAHLGNTPRDAEAGDAAAASSQLTGADVRMAAAATIGNLSRSSVQNRHRALFFLFLSRSKLPCC